MERYSINRNLKKDINIGIEIPMSNTQVGLTESINRLVVKETENSVNPFDDTEQIAYKTFDKEGIDIAFRFYDNVTNTFQQDYAAAGFNTISGLTKSSFLRSYFRLYFYDKNEPQGRNLLLFEELDVSGTIEPVLKLNRIFWKRSDLLFKETLENRTLYVIGRFFNALTGKVQNFINIPLTYTSPINITDYSQNSDWWSSPIIVINPKNNGGDYNFDILPLNGANTLTTITLTEQIIV